MLWLDKWRRARREKAHKAQCRAVLGLPAIVPRNDGLIILSMIGTAVLMPYLLAVKSLHHQLQRGRIVLVNDGTLTAEDRQLLAKHAGTPAIMELRDIDTRPCPTGGCWERLHAILGLRDEAYVIQLDSDTVTLGPMPEVAQAIAENRSFTLAGGAAEAARGPLPIRTFLDAFYPDGPRDGHIQHVVESRMAALGLGGDVRYARGCAGFAGFAKGGPGRAAVAAFSHAAAGISAGRWAEWGTEQIASNYLIANDPDAVLLPYARYTNYWGEAWGPDMRFIHFVGAWRYADHSYSHATHAAMQAMRGADGDGVARS